MSFRRFPFHLSDAESFDRMNTRSEESRNMFQETSSSSRRNDWQQNESHLEEPVWRGQTPPFRHSPNSVPGSAYGIRGPFPSNWPTTGIPIKVIHETKKSDSDASRESNGSTQEGSQSSNTQSPREPRVHHIPIMVEPRDGTSSGYVSDSGSEKSTEATRKNPVSDNDSQEQVKRSNSGNKVNGPSQHSDNITTHEATKAAKISEGVRKPHVHHIPITVEPRAGDIHPPGKPTRKQSPLRHAFPPRTSCEDQPCDGPAFSSRKVDSASSAEQQRFSAKKNLGRPGNGPHVTKVPINVAGDHSFQSSPPVNPAEVALNQIAKIDSEVDELRKQVDAFSGTNQDKQYRYLDEMLTRCMLKLDDIDTIGMDAIRKSRKLVINKVQECISLLESKLVGSKGTAELANTETSSTPGNSVAPADNSDAIQTDHVTLSIEEGIKHIAEVEKSGASEDALNKTVGTSVCENASEHSQTSATTIQTTNIGKDTGRTNEAEENMDIDKQAESESSSKNQESCDPASSMDVDKESSRLKTDSVEIDAKRPHCDTSAVDNGESKTDSMETDKETSASTPDNVETGKGPKGSYDGMEVDKEASTPTANNVKAGKDSVGSGGGMEVDKEASAPKAD